MTTQLLLNDAIYPIFASDPSVSVGGMPTRYATKSAYAAVSKPQPAVAFLSRPFTTIFEPIDMGVDMARKDFVAFFAMACQSYDWEGSLVDRTRNPTPKYFMRWDGKVTYTAQAVGVTRGSVSFHSVRKLQYTAPDGGGAVFGD